MEGDMEIKKLYENFINADLYFIDHNFLDISAVYGFWWTGSKKKLIDGKRDIELKGPGNNKLHTITWQLSWFPDKLNNKYPLYIGKTQNLQQRISQHLCNNIKSKKWYSVNHLKKFKNVQMINRKRLLKRTSMCQFRAGLEHLFTSNGFEEIEHIKISYLEFDKTDEKVAERFYLEDYLIGYLRPWFNLDSER